MVPGTWRVVFSSTGDLAPARGAAISPPSDRTWVQAVRRRLRPGLDSIAVVAPSDCRVYAQPLIRNSRVPISADCLAWLASLASADVNPGSVCGEAPGWRGTAMGQRTEGAALRGRSRRAYPHFDDAVFWGAYDGVLRRTAHLLKHDELRQAAKVIGAKPARSSVRYHGHESDHQGIEIAGRMPSREENADASIEAVA